MEKASSVIRILADILETVETIETDEENYEITSLKPRTDDLLATDTVAVELSLCIPFLATDDQRLALTPEEVRLDDDGSLQVDLMVATAPNASHGEGQSRTERRPSGGFDAGADDASRSMGAVTADCSASESADGDVAETADETAAMTVEGNAETITDEGVEATSGEGVDASSDEGTDPTANDGAGATADATADLPAYRDPDRLEAVYEELADVDGQYARLYASQP